MENLTLLTDLYQLTMAQGYYKSGKKDDVVVFDLFYRKNPFGGGYAVAAGLQQAIDYIKNLKFSVEDYRYLYNLKIFDMEFLSYLLSFKFTGDIFAVPEGTIMFPMEPLIRVKAPIIEAQIIETTLLNIINHQTLIATKASRIRQAAGTDQLLEFGLRRAQGPDAAVYGARAAVIGGFNATSDIEAGRRFDIPVKGTHAHSWVMSFPDELTSFKTYVENFPNAAILLVDTYDTLKFGVPNAIKAFDWAKEQEIELGSYGIRIDSGDLAYLSKQARTMLDEAGYKDAIITVSNDLDEYLIEDLKRQNAPINLWGVGTKLITADGDPALGGVYKLCAEYVDGKEVPKIKIADNAAKVTNPGVKKIFRIYNSKTMKIKADIIALDDEKMDPNKDLMLMDEYHQWRKMEIAAGTYSIRELLEPIFKDGMLLYEPRTLQKIQNNCSFEMDTLWDEYKRFKNPHVMPVDLSDQLFETKRELIYESKRQK